MDKAGDCRRVLFGISASSGVALGPATVFDRASVPVVRRRVGAAEVDAEVARIERAIDEARREIEQARDALDPDAGADHRLLLDTELMMHADELLPSRASALIRAETINAEWALRRTIDEVAGRLARADEHYFRERASDVRLVGEHILRVLTGVSRRLPELDEPTVLVAHDLTPAEAARLPVGAVLALVTAAGSASSHTAILARALEVPAVVGVADITRFVGPGEEVLVDALRGRVVVHPSEEEGSRARARAERYRAFRGRLLASRRAAETKDGQRIALSANLERASEAGAAKEAEADGVGLFRTEFLYLDRSSPPDEEEQLAQYVEVASRLAPRPVTFRTFDLGVDKVPSSTRRRSTSALGLRALRLAFERPELFRTQLRALLRAATHGNVQVMFPMVSGVSDLRRARAALDEARASLDSDGLEHGAVPVGCMLEVPAAVMVADRLALEVDFFSVGTNDLIQYALAIDRADPRVARLARGLEPAVLRMLERALEAARTAERPISICGELAADPIALPVLVGLGYRRFSMPISALPLAREVVSHLELAPAAALARACLDEDDADRVERRVLETFGGVLGDLWAEQGLPSPREEIV